MRANAAAGAAMVPAVTWIGHASTLVQVGGANVLTDPIFSERASPLSFAGPKRALAPGIALADLPHIDAVLVSHNHYDHLDAPSVKALAAQAGGSPLFIVPLGLKAWLADAGIANAVELDWWQSTRVGALEIVLTPVQHWSGRSLTDRMKTLWGGYAIFAPDFQVFFAGDTAYSKDFADIHARFAAAPRRRARLRPGADPDRRLRAALVHERAARRSRRGGEDPPRPRAPSARSAFTGARSSSPTNRSTSRRWRSRARRATPASPTTPSR